MQYKKVVRRDGALLKKYYEEVPGRIANLKKGEIRRRITEKIFDTEDSVADNNKLIMMILLMFKKLYDSNFDTTTLTEEDKNMIETIFIKFSDITTRFEEQFGEEGVSLIDKLLDRQQAVNDEIKAVYEE